MTRPSLHQSGVDVKIRDSLGYTLPKSTLPAQTDHHGPSQIIVNPLRGLFQKSALLTTATAFPSRLQVLDGMEPSTSASRSILGGLKLVHTCLPYTQAHICAWFQVQKSVSVRRQGFLGDSVATLSWPGGIDLRRSAGRGGKG